MRGSASFTSKIKYNQLNGARELPRSRTLGNRLNRGNQRVPEVKECMALTDPELFGGLLGRPLLGLPHSILKRRTQVYDLTLGYSTL